MPNFNVAEAKKTPQIVIRDGRGDVVTVVTPRDLQVGFEGNPGALILKGALDISAFVLQINSPVEAANVRVSNDKIAYFILNDSGEGVTVRLPTPPANPGQTHIIKDYRGSASNLTPITITTNDGSTIDGEASQSIVVAYGAIMFVWTGQGWVSLALGASGTGGGAPNNARYVVWGTEAALSNSRVLSVTSGHLTLDTTSPNANLGLADTGTPGTYTFPSQITIDSQGRVTSVTSTPGSVDADREAQYVVLASTASLPNERVATQGLGIRITDGGANGPVTWAINNNVVATTSGSTFSGATLHTAGLSGSLTRLTDGRSYIVGGSGITIVSASNGQITITGLAGSSSIDAPINATYLVLTADGTLTAERVFTPANGIKSTDAGAGGAYNIFIDDRIVATISGSTFSGATLHTAGLSGSLTRLTNGQSYLVAGSNIIITSSSNGQITISSTASGSISGSGGGTGTGDNGASYVVLGLTASLSNERVLTAGTGISIIDNGPNGTVVIGLAGASSQSADVYNGHCTGALNWTSTTWSDFANVPGNFTDTIQSGIIRSGSFWSVSKDGYYHWHSLFNSIGNTNYIGWRLSGSAGTLLQHVAYAQSTDQHPGILQGILQLTSGSSFRLQYCTKQGTTDNFSVNDLLDGENMRTGQVSMFRIADPITVGSGSGGTGTGTGDNSATYVVMSATASLANERVLTAGTGISITDGGAGGNVTISSTGGGGGNFTIGYAQSNYAFVTNSNEINVAQGNTFVGIPDLTGTITTAGSPVMISVNANYFVVSGSPQSTAIFSLARNGVNIGHPVWGNMVAGPQVVGYNNNASFWFVDYPASGTYSYSLIACAPTGSGKLSAAGLGPTTLMAFEMKGANVVTASTTQQQAVPGGALAGLSASILPTRGPVLALASLNYSNNLAGNWAWNTIRRGVTDLGSTFGIGLAVGTTAGEMQNFSISVLDTPALGTTHTYSVRATNGVGTGIVGRNGQIQTLILWEIPDVNYKYASYATLTNYGSSYTDVVPSSPSLSVVSRGRPILVIGCAQSNTTSATARAAFSFLRNGTSVVSASKGLQILDGEGNSDWNKQATFFWLDTDVTGASTYQLAAYNISGTNNAHQGPTLGSLFVYELDAGNEVVAGPWIDGGTRIKTTASVAISDGESIYADQKGTDVFFYVSGTIGSLSGSSDVPKKTLFGGDVITSGTFSTALAPIFGPPPASSSWIPINTSGATILDENGTIFMSKPSAAGPNVSLLMMSSSKVPFKATAQFAFSPTLGSSAGLAGLYTREASSGRLIGFGYHWDTGPVWKNYLHKLNSETSINSDYTTNNNTFFYPYVWLQVEDDGTNRIHRMSYDGKYFYQIHSVSRTDFMTANMVGWGIDTQGAAAQVRLVSWKVE